METQNGQNVPFLEPASLKKRKRKAMKRIKQNDEISKKGNNKKKKKKSCHLVPKVLTLLEKDAAKGKTFGVPMYLRYVRCTARHVVAAFSG